MRNLKWLRSWKWWKSARFIKMKGPSEARGTVRLTKKFAQGPGLDKFCKFARVATTKKFLRFLFSTPWMGLSISKFLVIPSRSVVTASELNVAEYFYFSEYNCHIGQAIQCRITGTGDKVSTVRYATYFTNVFCIRLMYYEMPILWIPLFYYILNIKMTSQLLSNFCSELRASGE